MSAHRPKTAALLAYADELLSPGGRARVDRHLARCEVCQRELASIVLYEKLAEDARQSEVPEVDFRRMEATLAREADRVSREIVLRKRRPWAWVALAAAAAALLALYVGWPAPNAPVAARSVDHGAHPLPAPQVEAARLEPIVTLAAGSAERLGAGALEAGAVLREGERVRTGDDGLLHVRLADATGFVAEPRSEVELTWAREDRIALTLERGRVDSAATLRNGSSYVVLGAGYEVSGEAARFAVSYVDLVLGVDVAEGSVRVETPSGEEIVLRAPARWRSSGSAEGEPEVRSPRELAESGAPVTAVSITHPAIVRWAIDGSDIASGGPLRLRLAPGEHELRGWDLRGRLFTALVPVGSEPVFVEPAALTPEPPRLRPGHLPPEEINRVLQRGRTQLARCYERTLRLHPEVHGRLRLRVTVGLMGDVRRVSVLGAEAEDTAELSQCISTYAERWTFPPPGGPVTFELPLAFTSRP